MVGSNNTITVTGTATNWAPDLDWIEVVDVASTVPSTGVCQPTMWTVTSSVNGSSTANLVDGSVNLSSGLGVWTPATSTRWTSGTASYTGQYVQVDFTGTVILSTITLDHSNDGSSGDFPGTYAVYTSQDGVTFSNTAVATGRALQTRPSSPSPRKRFAPSASRRRAPPASAVGGRSATSRPTATSRPDRPSIYA
jgi:hypothetical protein